MQISSTIHLQPGQVQYMVFDVRAGDKPLLAGVMVGDLTMKPPRFSEVGNECHRRLIAAHQASTNNNTVHLVELRRVGKAKERVRTVCKAAARHDAIAFVCIDDDTCAAVVQALGLHR